MAKILSKGITLKYGGSGSAYSSTDEVTIQDMTTTPSLGGDKNQVETTTLSDSAIQRINGLVDYGDLEFGFVYDDEDKYPVGDSPTQTVFEYLKTIENANPAHDHDWWKVSFPNSGITFTFSGQPAVSMGGGEVGSRVDFTMKLALNSDIVVA